MSIGIYMIRDASACAAPATRARAGTTLLRLALAHRFGAGTAAWQIGRAANGARVITNGPDSLPALSVAHSGDLLVVAVAPEVDGGMGVDIERPRPRSYARIARHLEWPDSWWAEAGAPTPDEFLHRWTLWEALFKATPDAPLADLRATFATGARVRAGAPGEARARNWRGHSWRGPAGCWLSVVSRSARAVATGLFRVDTLADDVDSARIQTITASEGEFSF